MKILLVALNAHYMHTNLAVRQMLPALGAFDARIHEGHINQPYRQILSDIARDAPDAVCFSCYIWNMELVLRLCRALRAALPRAAIILGGPEAAHREFIPEADHILRGEGERQLPLLLSALERGDEPRIDNLPLLSPGEWTDAYAGGIAGFENRILYIETSRGCPFRCGFCLSSVAGPVRALPADEAVRRLTRLADQGAQLIKLVDRTFNFDRERANAIWRGLIAHAVRTGYRGTYHFEIGAQLIDEAAVAVLGEAPAGLFQFEIGVQSSDEQVLANVSRGAPFQRIAWAVQRLRELNTIHLHLDLIAGMPGDTMESFARSFDDVFLLGAEQLQLGFLKLLRGSPLRAEAGARGVEFEPDPPYEVISTREMTFFQLCHLKDVERALDWYANSGRYRCAMKWLLGSQTPFALFSHLAGALRRAGVLDAERGEKARAQALIDVFPDEVTRELVRHDLLRAGRRRDLPDALQFQEDAAERALLRERFHPVRGQSAYRYSFDVPAFESGGSIQKRSSLLVYDPPGYVRL